MPVDNNFYCVLILLHVCSVQCPTNLPAFIAWGWFLDPICQFDNRISRFWISHESSFTTHSQSKHAYLCIHSRNQGQIKGTWFSHSISVSFKPVLIHLISKVTDKMMSFIKMIHWFKTNLFLVSLTASITLHLCYTVFLMPSWKRC